MIFKSISSINSAIVRSINPMVNIRGWIRGVRKKNTVIQTRLTEINTKKNFQNSDSSSTLNNNFGAKISTYFSLGNQITQGANGIIYEDKNNPNYIYKMLKPERSSTAENLKEEIINFKKYYGEDSAQFIDKYCIRMRKLPGKTLREIEKEENGIDRIRKHGNAFNKMVMKMHSLGLIHGDFTMDNILLDEKTGIFYPVDITNIRHSSDEFIEADILIANKIISYLTKGTDKAIAFEVQDASPIFDIKMTFI